MVTETNQGSALPTVEDMDATAKRGWDAFVKFLAGNVALAVVGLVLIALLTVWS